MPNHVDIARATELFQALAVREKLAPLSNGNRQILFASYLERYRIADSTPKPLPTTVSDQHLLALDSQQERRRTRRQA